MTLRAMGLAEVAVGPVIPHVLHVLSMGLGDEVVVVYTP
jgi:hypothetical protein